jgi:hypothetical protein
MKYKQLPLILIAALLPIISHAAGQTFDFDSSFEGWQQQWAAPLAGGPGSLGIVTLDSTKGFSDSSSLKFDMGNGLGDDGTLWIERTFSATNGVPIEVSVDFELFSLQQSDFNTFTVVAYVGNTDPNAEVDFSIVGSTDTAAGWVQYNHSAKVTPVTNQVWVAVGISIVWETHRDYWIDHVSVAGVPEPVGETPSLAIALTGANTVRVSWPSPSTGFILEENHHLSPTNWLTLSEPVTDDGTNKFIVVNPATGSRFYRLHKP